MTVIRDSLSNSQKTITSMTMTGSSLIVPADLIVLFVSIASAATFTTPTGYTSMGTPPGVSRTDAAFYKSAVSGDVSASIPIVWGGVSTNGIGTQIVFKGAAAFLAATSGLDTASSSSHNAPSVTFSGPAEILEYVSDKSSTPGTSWTVPTGFTKIIDTYQTGSGSVTSVAALSNSATLTSPQGGDTYTNTAVSTQTGKWSIALTPAPAGYRLQIKQSGGTWLPASVSLL